MRRNPLIVSPGRSRIVKWYFANPINSVRGGLWERWHQESGVRIQENQTPLPPAGAEVFADSDGVVAAPGAVRSQIGWAEKAIAGAEAIEEEVLRNPHFETFTHVNGGAPGVLNSNRVKGPCVQILGDVLTEEEVWFTPEHEAAQRTPAKGTDLQNSREHIAGKGVTGRALPSVDTRIGGANIRIDLVMGRSDLELGVSPKRVRGKEETVLCGPGRLLGVQNRAEKHCNKTKHEFLHGFSRRRFGHGSAPKTSRPEIGLIFDGSVDYCLNVALYKYGVASTSTLFYGKP